MTKHFNKKQIQKRRRLLRSNMTFSEKIVWMYLRKRQMKERFLRQYSVDSYIIDFYCPKLKINRVWVDFHLCRGRESISHDLAIAGF